MKKTLLSIDCGTQSLRALLFSPEGELLERVQVSYDPYFSPRPGWAEQNPEIFWDSLFHACKELKERRPNRYSEIAGVGVTAQRNTLINLDEKGNPLRPAITWLDQRKAGNHLRRCVPLTLALKAAGLDAKIHRLITDGKSNWIRRQEPHIWRRTEKYVQVSGFLNHRLTGKFRDSAASQIGHVPFHYQKIRWCRPYEIAALLFPVEKEKLPEIVPPSATIGAVTAEASEATGLKRGIPVIACGSDKGCETIGMGVIDPTIASLSFGTTATVQTTTQRYFEPVRFMPSYPAPVPAHYNPEIEIFRGFWMVTWFKKEFGHPEIIAAEKKGTCAEEELDRLLAQSPPGAMGLTVHPYWSPGLKTPDAKGAIIGFGDVHTRAHIYRAVIEGLGYALLDGMRTIEKAGKTRFEKVAVSGGASRSDQICRITADIFNLPLVRGRTAETSGLGAAIVTAVGLGLYPDFQSAIRGMAAHDRVFTPNSGTAGLYRELYERVYRNIYPALRPLHRELRDITGYPEK